MGLSRRHYNATEGFAVYRDNFISSIERYTTNQDFIDPSFRVPLELQTPEIRKDRRRNFPDELTVSFSYCFAVYDRSFEFDKADFAVVGELYNEWEYGMGFFPYQRPGVLAEGSYPEINSNTRVSEIDDLNYASGNSTVTLADPASNITNTAATLPTGVDNLSWAVNQDENGFWRFVEFSETTPLTGLANTPRLYVPTRLYNSSTGDTPSIAAQMEVFYYRVISGVNIDGIAIKFNCLNGNSISTSRVRLNYNSVPVNSASFYYDEVFNNSTTIAPAAERADFLAQVNFTATYDNDIPGAIDTPGFHSPGIFGIVTTFTNVLGSDMLASSPTVTYAGATIPATLVNGWVLGGIAISDFEYGGDIVTDYDTVAKEVWAKGKKSIYFQKRENTPIFLKDLPHSDYHTCFVIPQALQTIVVLRHGAVISTTISGGGATDGVYKSAPSDLLDYQQVEVYVIRANAIDEQYSFTNPTPISIPYTTWQDGWILSYSNASYQNFSVVEPTSTYYKEGAGADTITDTNSAWRSLFSLRSTRHRNWYNLVNEENTSSLSGSDMSITYTRYELGNEIDGSFYYILGDDALDATFDFSCSLGIPICHDQTINVSVLTRLQQPLPADRKVDVYITQGSWNGVSYDETSNVLAVGEFPILNFTPTNSYDLLVTNIVPDIYDN